jgi:hypothetical protein
LSCKARQAKRERSGNSDIWDEGEEVENKKEIIVSKKLALVLVVVSLLALLVVGCAKPLTLTILGPTQGSTRTNEKLEVKGSLSDSKATVWVNDVIVAVRKASGGTALFSTEVTLAEGKNTINVVAARGKEGAWEEVVGRTVVVTYSPRE